MLARQIVRGIFYFSLRFRLLDARWKALGVGGMDPKYDCDACTYMRYMRYRGTIGRDLGSICVCVA